MTGFVESFSGQISIAAWLASGYALVLLAVAYGVDVMARRASRSTMLNATGGFTYHESHDAWLCPQDQWLWPTSFDPDNRVMRYRASPLVCGGCPVKDSCTSSPSREIARAVDAWPASEAARFHRGIACALVVMAVVWGLSATVGRVAWTYTGHDLVSEEQVDVRVDLRRDPARAVTCQIEARDERNAVVGRTDVEIGPTETSPSRHVLSVRSAAPAQTGYVEACWYSDEPPRR